VRRLSGDRSTVESANKPITMTLVADDLSATRGFFTKSYAPTFCTWRCLIYQHRSFVSWEQHFNHPLTSTLIPHTGPTTLSPGFPTHETRLLTFGTMLTVRMDFGNNEARPTGLNSLILCADCCRSSPLPNLAAERTHQCFVQFHARSKVFKFNKSW
jgi:hypothetical protein